MGYTPKRRIYRLVFDDEEYDGLVVKVRSTSVGQLLEFMEFLTMDTDSPSPDDVARIHGLFEAFAEVLAEWNVETDDGQPVPATLDGVKTQDAPFILAILRVWFGAVMTVPGPLPTASSNGAPSAAPSLPMEPLSPNPES